jgi:PIN domain nuclease of toxin-antitoxin system
MVDPAEPALDRSLLSNDTWSISAIVLWEIAKLSELGRIEVDLDHPELARTLARIQTWPLTLDICRSIKALDFDSDPADEIIAATSVVHRVPLVTRDRTIRRSKLVPDRFIETRQARTNRMRDYSKHRWI